METVDRGECTRTGRCPDRERIFHEGSDEVHPGRTLVRAATSGRPANDVIGRAYAGQRDF